MLSSGGNTWLYYSVRVANNSALDQLYELCESVPMRCRLGVKERWTVYKLWGRIIPKDTSFSDYLGFRTETDYFKFKICCMIPGVTLGTDFKVVDGEFK